MRIHGTTGVWQFALKRVLKRLENRLVGWLDGVVGKPVIFGNPVRVDLKVPDCPTGKGYARASSPQTQFFAQTQKRIKAEVLAHIWSELSDGRSVPSSVRTVRR